ncbi:hypothetical protein Moror_12437 [Moniliophthora roreri MCA 2997]|uniref:F-box domain-containing protein n=1 Tax=Moniliophthora roreri (strain MCA 2997) TaxID=1381753 RepID=V2XTG1_MONRO|nr:hypothetical protein Moror_12437 [Moniliophthora roreri MCA 2997]KAI3616224.1 hypothetical protein WG66_014012 [Moniliophthora roreri]
MDTPFNHLVGTNNAPSPEELEEIRNLVRKPEEQVRLLNEKISQLQAQRDKLQSFIDCHRVLLSPARRIPRDIISEVFLHCLPTDSLPVRSIGEAPLLLTTICRSWREIALTTPRLWRAFHFVFPVAGNILDDDFRSLFQARKQGLQLWLERARSVPLTLSLYMQNGPPKPRRVRDELQRMYPEFLDIVLQYSSQWKRLHLQGLPIEFLPALRRVVAGDVPLLDSLSLANNAYEFSSPWRSSEVDEYPFLNLIRASQSLRVMHLRYERLGDPFNLPIRWGELTELSMSLYSTSFPTRDPAKLIHKLAQACQSLRKCALDISLPSEAIDFEDVHPQSHTWPCLLEFNLNMGFSLRALKRFFSAISTPALSRFTLFIQGFATNLAETPAMYPESPFLGLILRSNAHISFLDLDLPISDKALIDSLQCMSSLTTLRLTGTIQPTYVFDDEGELIMPDRLWPTTLTSKLFQALTPTMSPASDEILCPLLERLLLKNCALAHTDSLVAMALARSSHSETASLKSLSVTFQPDSAGHSTLPAEVLAKAQMLRQEGVDTQWNLAYGGGDVSPFNISAGAGMPRYMGEY